MKRSWRILSDRAPNPPGNGDVGPQTLLRRASSSRLFSSLIILSVCCPCIVEISFKDSCRRQMSSLEAKASCDSILRISDTRTSSQVKATDARNMQNHESDTANVLRMQNDNTGVLKSSPAHSPHPPAASAQGRPPALRTRRLGRSSHRQET
jgi:hypothetical protein